MSTALAMHAHPDDVEILAGGTVALLAAAGHRVVIVTMTPGDCGSHKHGPDEIAAIRRLEAGNAARLVPAARHRDLASSLGMRALPRRRPTTAPTRPIRRRRFPPSRTCISWTRWGAWIEKAGASCRISMSMWESTLS